MIFLGEIPGEPEPRTAADALDDLAAAVRALALAAVEPLAVRLLSALDRAIEEAFEDRS